MKIKSILILVLVAGVLLSPCNTADQDQVEEPVI